jgi:tetratricopeptide (TPR) repeat protein
MIPGKSKNIIVIAAVIMLIVPAIYSAVLGKLRVKVVDTKGEPIAGVKITMESQRVPGLIHNIVTKKNGVAVQVGLENHVFLVTLEKEGYRTIKKNVKIPAGLTQDEQFTLTTKEEAQVQQAADDPRTKAINAYNRAVFHLKKDKYDDALAELKKAIALDDTIHQAHYYMGVAYYEKQQYKEAEAPLLKAIALKEDYTEAYRVLAAVYEKLGNKTESEKYTKLAQETGGKTAIDIYNEGIHAFNAGETDKAIAAFEEAIELDADMPDSYYRLGLCYLNKGENDKAIAALEKYIQLQPQGQDTETAKVILDSLKEQ